VCKDWCFPSGLEKADSITEEMIWLLEAEQYIEYASTYVESFSVMTIETFQLGRV